MTREVVSGAFSSMLVQGLRGVWDELKNNEMERAYGKRHDRHQSLIAVNEQITEEEARWLAERIGRDGTLHENEKALLMFIKQESPDIHPLLQPLMDKVA